MTTPEDIQKLEKGQVFVFGSNLAGNHAGGAAKLAAEKFGAQMGCGEGLFGKSYAFPTLGLNMEQRTMEELDTSRDKLFRCASKFQNKTFLLTRVGTGIARYDEAFMINLFKDAPVNIVKPKGW